MDKTTPLTAWHIANHANMMPFGGFNMPVHYAKGILHEHRLIRNQCGVFDVSHMGEFSLKGMDALKNLNYWCSNQFTDLAIGSIRYGILIREDGTSVDDLLVYKLDETDYLLVVNASNIDKDVTFIQKHLFGTVEFTNLSDHYGEIALQGPKSLELMNRLIVDADIPYYQFKQQVSLNGHPVLISRTGYTGEDGYEIYCQAEDTLKLWELLLDIGQDLGCEPCGLGARDTLRLEAGMPLFGHELSDDITPLEAGLKPFVKLDKETFMAQTALSESLKRKRIGLRITDRGIAREHCDVYLEDRKVGFVTSGTMSPSLGFAIAMAIVDIDVALEKAFVVDVRGRRLKAERVKLPFYKRQGEKV